MKKIINIFSILALSLLVFSCKMETPEESGSIVLDGLSREIAENDEVKRIYLGGKETWATSLLS